ncbi:unnamed protein product [Closterium sp. NIES-65]|nr:unnamed protein product [Closterium sp. NIES-65]
MRPAAPLEELWKRRERDGIEREGGSGGKKGLGANFAIPLGKLSHELLHNLAATQIGPTGCARCTHALSPPLLSRRIHFRVSSFSPALPYIPHGAFHTAATFTQGIRPHTSSHTVIVHSLASFARNHNFTSVLFPISHCCWLVLIMIVTATAFMLGMFLLVATSHILRVLARGTALCRRSHAAVALSTTANFKLGMFLLIATSHILRVPARGTALCRRNPAAVALSTTADFMLGMFLLVATSHILRVPARGTALCRRSPAAVALSTTANFMLGMFLLVATSHILRVPARGTALCRHSPAAVALSTTADFMLGMFLLVATSHILRVPARGTALCRRSLAAVALSTTALACALAWQPR